MLGVDVQVIREDDAFEDAVEKKSHSITCEVHLCWCRCTGLQVTREDDTFIGAAGKISHSMDKCSAFVLDVECGCIDH